MVRRLIVLAQQVFAKIPVEVAPHRMDMVGVVLGIVVFKQEAWRLDAIVVSVARLDASGPGEVHSLTIAQR